MELQKLSKLLPHRRYGVVGIVFLGLALGLVYVFLVPPWQHYDEPGHFEYAWLMANDSQAIDSIGYNQWMRREVAASMIENDFFDHAAGFPNLLSQTEPIWIGISQVGDQPLYYWLISLPLRLAKFSDITIQLYIARIASLSLFSLVILSAWGIMKELIPNRQTPFVWLVPLTIVLIPGVIDIMSSVNNDVGAAAFFSLFLWGTVRLLARRPEPIVLVITIAAAAASYYSKSTVWFALPLLFYTIVLVVFPARFRWIAWASFATAIFTLLVAVLGIGNAAGWVIPGVNVSPTRQEIRTVPEPQYALHITLSDQRLASTLRQSFSPEIRGALKGNKVSIGGRAWSSVEARLEIGLNSSTGWVEKIPIIIDNQKERFSFMIDIPEDAENIWFEVTGRTIIQNGTPVEVFLDSVFLQLIHPATANPPLIDGALIDGDLNLLSNPSGKKTWLRLRRWTFDQIDHQLYSNLNYGIYSVSKIPATSWYYNTTTTYLIDTFWSRLGWGNVELPLMSAYIVLRLVWFWGVTGAIISLFVHRRHLPWSMVLLLVITAIFLWVQALMRGIGSLFGPIWIPSARYALPAVIPTVLGICAGWYLVIRWFTRNHTFRLVYFWYAYWVFFAVLNTMAVLSLVGSYYL